MKRVVITGMGAATAIGNTVKEFTNVLMAGQTGAAPITKFDAVKFKTQFACPYGECFQHALHRF